MTETREFAVDAAVSPSGVGGSHVDDEPADLCSGGRPPWSAGGLGPVARDATSVPAEQGVGGDDPTDAQSAGERCCYSAKQAAVLVVDKGAALLALEDGELVAEHDDLEVFRTS